MFLLTILLNFDNESIQIKCIYKYYDEILFVPEKRGTDKNSKDVKTSSVNIPRSVVILHNIYKIIFSKKSNK
jgi:hypothetical protein